MKKAFTLIELLIVVAIIAILAAIAVPNFLEAQTRAKVARAVEDMRSLTTALETYTVDHNTPMTEYPRQNTFTGYSAINRAIHTANCVSPRFIRLTTPIAYFTHIPPEPFAKNGLTNTPAGITTEYDTYDYWTGKCIYGGENLGSGLSSGATWRLASSGPDTYECVGGYAVGNALNKSGVDYDPTNGTLSVGDIVRTSGAAAAPGQRGIAGIDRVGRLKYNDPAL